MEKIPKSKGIPFEGGKKTKSKGIPLKSKKKHIYIYILLLFLLFLLLLCYFPGPSEPGSFWRWAALRPTATVARGTRAAGGEACRGGGEAVRSLKGQCLPHGAQAATEGIGGQYNSPI